MQSKLPPPDVALASQMDWQQGVVTSRGGVFGSPVILEGWQTARSTIALESLLRRSVEQGPDLFGALGRGDRSGRARLDGLFHAVRDLLSRECPHLEYSPLLSQVIRTAHDMGLDFRPLTKPSEMWLSTGEWTAPGLVAQARVFDELLSRVTAEGRRSSMALECRRWREQADADFRSATTYLEACLRDEPQLYVLRMNLGDWGALLADPPRLPVVGNVQDIKVRFSRFAKELSRGAPESIVGYLARLDFGPQKGFFYHVVILLRATEARGAVDLCERLGRRWVGLSPEGHGAYTACNWVFHDPAASIGLIDAGRAADRVAMERWVLSYLTLSSRYTRVRLKPRQRVFTRGTLPREGS